MFELNRDQNDCSLDEYSAENGEKIRTLYTEKDEKYVEPLHPISFIPWNNQKFLLWSQKDGYMHLYVGNLNKDLNLKQLTKGNFVVDEILGFCAKTKSVIIRSNEANPLQMNLWSVNIETGKRTMLDKGKGVHKGKLSESGLYITDSYSEPTVPHNIDILFATNKKPVR